MNACDGCGKTHTEVHRLPTGGDSAVIVCWNCYRREIAFRKAHNRELEPSCRFDLPAWTSLEVYDAYAVMP